MYVCYSEDLGDISISNHFSISLESPIEPFPKWAGKSLETGIYTYWKTEDSSSIMVDNC